MHLRPLIARHTLPPQRPLSPCLTYHYPLLRTRRRFTSSTRRPGPDSSRPPAPTPTHYEILKVSPSATPAQLKKQFYVLSKETHPDVNKHDPSASDRFAQISESYSILSNAQKRDKYDRDLARAQPRHAHARRGSYAGSRPATGLSKRRTVFKGPPPSFYAHGNTDAANTNNTGTGTGDAGQHANASSYQAGTFNAGAYSEYAAQFDPSRVYRTQTVEDQRRNARRAAEIAASQADADDDRNFWTRFIVVTGVVVLGVSIGTILAGVSMTKRGSLVRSDGSRRGGQRNEWTKG